MWELSVGVNWTSWHLPFGVFVCPVRSDAGRIVGVAAIVLSFGPWYIEWWDGK